MDQVPSPHNHDSKLQNQDLYIKIMFKNSKLKIKVLELK